MTTEYYMIWFSDETGKEQSRLISTNSYEEADENAKTYAKENDIPVYTIRRVHDIKVVRNPVTVEEVRDRIEKEITTLRWKDDNYTADKFLEVCKWINKRM